jgi:glucan-binding YG repeat protein
MPILRAFPLLTEEEMTISAPDDVPRLELLLADIRDVFKETEMSSADLVKGLVAIEGRPWAEMGKAGKPLTQNKLARMLKPLGIAPKQIRFGDDDSRKGYRVSAFQKAFERYLAPEGASQPKQQNKCDETSTSDNFKPKQEEGSGEKAKVTATNGSAEPGLSSHRIQEHADWYSDQAYWHYSKNALDAGALDAELRRILRKEVFPEHVESEFERVMKVIRSKISAS